MFDKYDVDFSGKIERNEAYKVIEYIIKEMKLGIELNEQFMNEIFDVNDLDSNN